MLQWLFRLFFLYILSVGCVGTLIICIFSSYKFSDCTFSLAFSVSRYNPLNRLLNSQEFTEGFIQGGGGRGGGQLRGEKDVG